MIPGHADAIPMSAVPVVAVPASTTAVAAFLRGVGRRAVVFADLQSGDHACADTAVAAAIRAFRAAAPTLELVHWPHAFWSALVEAPALRGAGPAASDWARMPAGPRAALLLRLAAGLDEAEAARVLGIGVPVYRRALQRAVATERDDVAALQAQLQQRIAAVSPERVERLARDEMAAARDDDGVAARPRALLAVLWTLLLLCVAAFAMTFRWTPEPEAAADVHADPRGAPLPPAAAPASRFGDEAARVVHRDFALLVDAEAAPFLRELEFYGWLAAQGDAAAVEPDSTVTPDAATEPFTALGLETDDAPL